MKVYDFSYLQGIFPLNEVKSREDNLIGSGVQLMKKLFTLFSATDRVVIFEFTVNTL